MINSLKLKYYFTLKLNKPTHTDLQIYCGGYSQVEADVHFSWDDIVGDAPFDHGHIHCGDITKSETLTDV